MYTILFIRLYHFSKKGSGWTGGIKNIYHDPCQDWLDLANMKLTSPKYPDRYDPLVNCKWTIAAPQDQFVSLDFDTIDVRNHEICTLFNYTRSSGYTFSDY